MKERILDAAIELFSTCGYRGATLRHIAELAKCSPGSIYDHFQDKLDLFRQAFRHEADRIRPQLSKGVKLRDKKFRARKLATACATNPRFMRLLSAHEQELTDEKERFLQQLVDDNQLKPAQAKHFRRAFDRAGGVVCWDVIQIDDETLCIEPDTVAWLQALFYGRHPLLAANDDKATSLFGLCA